MVVWWGLPRWVLCNSEIFRLYSNKCITLTCKRTKQWTSLYYWAKDLAPKYPYTPAIHPSNLHTHKHAHLYKQTKSSISIAGCSPPWWSGWSGMKAREARMADVRPRFVTKAGERGKTMEGWRQKERIKYTTKITWPLMSHREAAPLIIKIQ